MFIIPKSYYAIRKSKKAGRSAFTNHDIEAGTVIGDYMGTIIKSDSNDENKTGLYDMRGGEKYDILANPKDDGIHLINHSCANNVEAYPYRGHILYFALRKIFKGEEITVNYGLGTADEKDIVCRMHACHCGARICRGTMHDPEKEYDEWYVSWEKLLKKQFGPFYKKKIPGKYGTKLPILDRYPEFVSSSNVKVYANMFGTEMKPPKAYPDTVLPSSTELRKRISETGMRLAFPKLNVIIYGMLNHIVIAERK